MHIGKIREKEVKNNCHLSEKAEEDQKEAKEAAALFNAPIAAPWYRAIRQKEILAEYRSSNLN